MRLRANYLTFFVAVAFTVLVLPTTVHAGIPFLGPIVPDAINRCAAGWGAVIQVLNNLISFLITIVVVFIAPIMIAWAGFLMVMNPTSVGDISRGKQILQNTAIGIVVALSGWLIVDAMMAVLYNAAVPNPNGGVLGTWYNLINYNGDFCLIQEGSLNDLNQVGMSDATAIMVVTPSVASEAETGIRQTLLTSVGINNPPCNPYNSDGVVNKCTNVGGLRPATVSQVLELKKKCGSSCPVTITGGSEAGHASGTYSHSTGYKVDLALNQTLDAFLEKMPVTGQRGGDSNADPIREDSCGKNLYVKESNHWDITVYGTCSF